MKTKLLHQIALVLILIIGVGMMFMAQGSTALQRSIIVMTAIAYLAWGIIHHILEGDLHFKIVLEYIFISATAIVLLFSLFT